MLMIIIIIRSKTIRAAVVKYLMIFVVDDDVAVLFCFLLLFPGDDLYKLNAHYQIVII